MHASTCTYIGLVLESKLEGTRSVGRQRLLWSDNIKEWTGMSMTDCTRAAKNRQQWKIIARRPQGPLRRRWHNQVQVRIGLCLSLHVVCDCNKVQESYYQIIILIIINLKGVCVRACMSSCLRECVWVHYQHPYLRLQKMVCKWVGVAGLSLSFHQAWRETSAKMSGE